MKARQPTSNRQGTRGSVLIAVLAVILLLSFLVSSFLDEAVEDLEYRSIFSEPMDVRSYAFSIMEVALATIHEVALIDEGKIHALEQGWSDPLTYAKIKVPNGWEVEVRFEDESRKLSINTMSEEMLILLFEESLELDFGTSRELSSMLLDWIDADDSRRLNGAESEDYLRRNPPYEAANKPLQSLEELRLIEIWEDEFFDERGQPNELFQRFASMVSIYNGSKVNLNNASAEVLELLSLKDGYDDRTLFDGLEPEKPYLTATPESVDPSRSGVEVTLLRITVRVLRGNVPFTISALLEPDFTEQSDANQSIPAGRRDDDVVRTGSVEEQDRINYPFRILYLSEFMPIEPNLTRPARYSEIDIELD